MTSKCGKSKNVAYEYKTKAECVTDVLIIVWRLLWSITEQTSRKIKAENKQDEWPYEIYLFCI